MLPDCTVLPCEFGLLFGLGEGLVMYFFMGKVGHVHFYLTLPNVCVHYHNSKIYVVNTIMYVSFCIK